MKWKLKPSFSTAKVTYRTIAENELFFLQESRIGSKKARIVSSSDFGFYIICKSKNLSELAEAWKFCLEFQLTPGLTKDNFLVLFKDYLQTTSLLSKAPQSGFSSTNSSKSESPVPSVSDVLQPTDSCKGYHSPGYCSTSASETESARASSDLSTPPTPSPPSLNIPVVLCTPPKLVISQEDAVYSAPPHPRKFASNGVRGRVTRSAVKQGYVARSTEGSQFRYSPSSLSLCSEEEPCNQKETGKCDGDSYYFTHSMPWLIALYALFLRFCPTEVFYIATLVTSVAAWRILSHTHQNPKAPI